MYKVEIVLIPIMSDGEYRQTDPNYFKILLTEDNQVLSQNLSMMNESIEQCVKEIHHKYINIGYEWSNKWLAGVIKKDIKTVQVIFIANLVYVKNCFKNCKAVNIHQFMEVCKNKDYERIISTVSPTFFQ
jgi:cystathionine beta-lyase family protein involved in aluminum resistance